MPPGTFTGVAATPGSRRRVTRNPCQSPLGSVQLRPSASASTGPRAASRSRSAASSASSVTPQTSRRRVEPVSKAGASGGSSAGRSSTSPPSRVSKRTPPSSSPAGARPQSAKNRTHSSMSSTPYTTLSIPVIIACPPLRPRLAPTWRDRRRARPGTRSCPGTPETPSSIQLRQVFGKARREGPPGRRTSCPCAPPRGTASILPASQPAVPGRTCLVSPNRARARMPALPGGGSPLRGPPRPDCRPQEAARGARRPSNLPGGAGPPGDP